MIFPWKTVKKDAKYFKFINKYVSRERVERKHRLTLLARYILFLGPYISRRASQPLFIERHVADNRKSPIDNPTVRGTILFLRLAGTGCVRSGNALKHRGHECGRD